MKRYLKTISSEEALRKILENVAPLKDEELLPVYKCRGRISSRPVYAKISNPPFMCAAMDGYATSFEKTLNADLSRPVSLKKGTDSLPVNTGDPLPGGTNAVVMVEDVEDSDSHIIIRKPVYLWQNVRMTGEDIIEGDMLIPANHTISAFDIGMIISGGVSHINIRKKPKTLIIPTGKELIDIYSPAEPLFKTGGLIDFNSHMLFNLAEDSGFEATISEIAGTKEGLQKKIEEATRKFDVVLINAGSSAGSEDFTEQIIKELGTLIFHGISMMPGKPAMFGIVNDKPVFGIPGYPVSAALIFKTLVKPLYDKLTDSSSKKILISCMTAYKIPSRLGIEEIIRVNIIKNSGKYYAIPLNRGASIFSSIARADGLVRIHASVEGYSEDEEIACELFTNEESLNQRIHIVGSHDLSLDILRDMMKSFNKDMDMISTHTGSLSGITAMAKGVSYICTAHILDEKDKIYNIPTIKKYLYNKPCKLIHIAKRQQGLLVRKDNPLKIKGIEDLSRPDVKFINRQAGSGTRILFDSLISECGIEKHQINGYDREESTHTAVGILVRESIADAGIAIYSIAKIFSLDFIPLAEEDYDMVVDSKFMGDNKFNILMNLINSGEFKKRLEQMGGYNTKETGRIKFTMD